MTTAPVTDDRGNTLAFLKIIRDRTAQISRSSRGANSLRLRRTNCGAADRFNWALQTLASASDIGENNKLIVDNADAASQNLLRRIEDLLNIAKMEDGQFGYEFEDTDIADFVASVLTMSSRREKDRRKIIL